MSKISESQIDQAQKHCVDYVMAHHHDKRRQRHMRRAIEIVGETKTKRMISDARKIQKMLAVG